MPPATAFYICIKQQNTPHTHTHTKAYMHARTHARHTHTLTPKQNIFGGNFEMMMTKTIMIKRSSEQSNCFPLYEDLTMVVRPGPGQFTQIHVCV